MPIIDAPPAAPRSPPCKINDGVATRSFGDGQSIHYRVHMNMKMPWNIPPNILCNISALAHSSPNSGNDSPEIDDLTIKIPFCAESR